MGMCLRMMEILQIIQSVIRFGVSGAAGKSVGCLLIIMNTCGMLCYIHSDIAVFMLDMWYAVGVSCVLLCCLAFAVLTIWKILIICYSV
jgi:hypothetical protein